MTVHLETMEEMEETTSEVGTGDGQAESEAAASGEGDTGDLMVARVAPES